MRIKYKPKWSVKHIRNGEVIWEDEYNENILHDEGEQFILQVVFDETASVPANYYVGVDARASLAEEDNLAAVSGEPSGSGYSRQAIASSVAGWTISQVGGNYQAASATATFTASGGDWTAVTKMFLATSSDGSGKLIASVALSSSRTVLNGDSLTTSLTITLSE